MDENKNSHENGETLWRRFDVITDDKEQLQRAEVLLKVKKIDRYDLALILATFRINPLLSEALLQSLLRVQKEKGGGKNMSITQFFQKAAVSSERFARELADAIEKMVDTPAGSIDRKQAKQELIKLIIYLTHRYD